MRLYRIELGILLVFAIAAIPVSIAYDQFSYGRAGWMALFCLCLLGFEFILVWVKAMNWRLLQAVVHAGLVFSFAFTLLAFVVEKCAYGGNQCS